MAQKLNIDIVARDKSKQALNGVQKSLGRLKQSIFNLQNAFIGLGAGLVIRNLVNTGKNLENLRVRLKFLLKDTNEGAKAFENMTKFASQVPFSLEEIQSGSGILATVTDNADELQKMLEITGNVASVTGLDFRTTAEQIQRSFSAGIGSADLFREKGVRNMLGFQAGATVSIEETVKAFEKVFGKGGRFGSATDELANTFEGTLSMIGDKIFNFKKVLLEAGFFEELKKQFGDLDEFLENNSKKIDDIATSVGKNLANAVVGAVNLGKDLIPFLSKVKDQLIGLKETFDTLPAVMKQAGIIGALMLGKKGILGLGLILKAIEKADEFGEKYGDKPLVFPEILPFESELSIPIEQKAIKKVNEELEYTNMMMREFEHEMSVAIPSATEKALERFKDLNSGALEKLKNKTDDIRNIIIDTVDSGIKNMSRGLAVAFVTGNKLTDVFKNMARTLAINVLSALIEIVARKGVELAIEKMITAEKKKQASLSAVSGGSSLFGMAKSFLGFAKGGAVSKGQPIVVGEQGAELFVPNQTGQITQSARGTGNGGATTVNFNINTVDASGFEELLVRSRGTITQLINNAVNERGSKNLI
jgi:ribosomal protein S17E